MHKGVTASGYAFAVDEGALNNMELVDALAEATDDNPLAISKTCELLLGKAERKKMYDFLRDEHGRVPIEAVSQNLVEIFATFGKQGKN